MIEHELFWIGVCLVMGADMDVKFMHTTTNTMKLMRANEQKKKPFIR